MKFRWLLKGNAENIAEQPHYTLLWVPPDQREPITLMLSVAGWKWARLGLAMLVAVLLGMMVTWGVFLHHALAYDRLTRENELLRTSASKITKLQDDLEKFQIFDDQLRRALGSRAELTPEDHALLKQRYRNRLYDRKETTSDLSNPAFLPTLMPTVGMVTRGFSDTPLAGAEGHRGIDIAAATGTPVIAPASGIVLLAGWTQQYGNTIVVGHPSGYTTMFGHLQNLFYGAGDLVRQGEPIGMTGNTGVSTAPHLHFEIWKNGAAIDPNLVITEAASTR